MVLKKQGARRSGLKDKRIIKQAGLDLSIIIPVQNDKDKLPEALIEIDRCLEQGGLNYEILLIDVGSVDNSFVAAKRLAELISNLRLIGLTDDNKKNQEEDLFRLVIQESKGNRLLFLDINRPFFWKEGLLVQLKAEEDKKYKNGSNDDVLVGVEVLADSEKKSIINRLIFSCQNLISRVILGVSLTIFVCLKKEAFSRFLPLIKEKNKISLIELSFLIKKLGCQADETTVLSVSQGSFCPRTLYFWRFLKEAIQARFLRR